MTLRDTADASTVDAWDEELWEDLLAYIEAGIVVPIIGRACYPVEIDGRAADDYNGVAFWRRIRDAVAQLTNKTPPGPVH
jgi:hypothetical protein